DISIVAFSAFFNLLSRGLSRYLMAAFTSAGIGFSTVLLLYTTVGFFFFQLSREVWRRLILLPALLLAFSNSFLSASVLASFSFNRAISLSLVLILFLYSLYLSAALRF